MLSRRTDWGFVLFIGAYILCMADALLFGYSTYAALRYSQALSYGFRILASVLLLAKLVRDRFYPLKTFLFMVLTGGILSLCFLRSGYSHIFYLMVLILGIRNVDVQRVLRVDFFARLFFVIFILLSGLLVIENYSTSRTGSDIVRLSVGFNHPNTLAALVLSLVLEDALLFRRKSTVVYTLVVWTIAAGVLFVTANRTSVALMVLFPILLFLVSLKSTGNMNAFFAAAAVWSCPVAAGFSYQSMKLCRKSSLFFWLDRLSGYRFYNCQRLLNTYGIPALGQKVNLISVRIARKTKSSIALLDVAYLRMLIQGGPIVLLLLISMYMRGVYCACRENDKLLVMIFVLYALFGLIESGFNNVYMNFSLLLAAGYLYPAPVRARKDE